MREINVLLIEDKKENAVFLEKTVDGLGYNALAADSLAEAARLSRERPFVAVLTELFMPDGNGKEITKEILKVNPQTNVIIITTAAFIDSAIEAMEEGAYAYIIKPFKPPEIRIVLERAVERFFLLSSGKDKEHFAQMSAKDGLTGAYNRRLLSTYLENKISSEKDKGGFFSFLMIDIDHFKRYNDTKGHLEGDELLKKIAKLFSEAIRKEDILFRYGGEEFLIILDSSDKKAASLVAERVRTLVNLYIPTTVSIGVSSFPADGSKIEELISKADKALYRAKEAGRDKVCVA